MEELLAANEETGSVMPEDERLFVEYAELGDTHRCRQESSLTDGRACDSLSNMLIVRCPLCRTPLRPQQYRDGPRWVCECRDY